MLLQPFLLLCAFSRTLLHIWLTGVKRIYPLKGQLLLNLRQLLDSNIHFEGLTCREHERIFLRLSCLVRRTEASGGHVFICIDAISRDTDVILGQEARGILASGQGGFREAFFKPFGDINNKELVLACVGQDAILSRDDTVHHGDNFKSPCFYHRLVLEPRLWHQRDDLALGCRLCLFGYRSLICLLRPLQVVYV